MSKYDNENDEENEDSTLSSTPHHSLLSPISIVFLAEFSGGYGFRELIHYFKLTNVDGSFIFSDKTINYCQSNATETILNVLDIRTVDLVNYSFNHTGPISYGVNMQNMRSALAVVGKKDGVRLFSIPSQPYIYIQHLGQKREDAGKRNASLIKVKSLEPIRIDVRGYKRSDEEPNCKIPVEEFCKTCSNLVRVKCEKINIRESKTAIRFQAFLDGGIAGTCCEFPTSSKTQIDLEEEKVEEIKLKRLTEYLASFSLDTSPNLPSSNVNLVIETPDPMISIDSSHIKALSKLTNTFKEGVVKIYFEKGLPLKLIFDNSYCRLTVFLRDNPTLNGGGGISKKK